MDILTTIQQCTLIVSALLGPANPPESDEKFEERVMVCSILQEEARLQNVPVDLVLAVAWQETDMTDAGTNSSGCSGPMQIKIKYWCPNKDNVWSPARKDGVLDHCDLFERGVFTLDYYLKRYKRLDDALCAYGWGTCRTPEQRDYVKQTLKYRKVIRYVMATLEKR